MTASNIIFTVSARAATVDSALTLRHHAGHGPVCQGGTDRRARNRKPASGRDVGRIANPSHMAFLPASWLVYASIGVLLGLAVLAKGPVGFLLPAASLGLFLLVMNEPGGCRPPRGTDRAGCGTYTSRWLCAGWSALFATRDVHQIAARDLGHAAADGAGLHGPGGLAVVRGDHLAGPTANG